MRNLHQSLKSTLSLGVLIMLMVTSCTNDPASLGIDILPTSDVLYAAADSHKVIATNTYPEHILSDGFTPGFVGIIGYFKDPRLGITKADIVAEINVGSTLDSLNKDGVNYFPDSLVLNLLYTYKSWYGKEDTKLNLKVYELTERLGADIPYYSDMPIEGKYNPILLGEKLISPDGEKNDSVWNEHLTDTISIKLSGEITQKLFDAKNISTEDKDHRDKIKDIVNGLYITVDDQPVSADEGALVMLDMINPLTNLTLHYRKEVYDITSDQVLSVSRGWYIFPINTEGRMFNRFEHTPSSNVKIDDPNAAKLYLQGMAGSVVKIDLNPIFEQWKDSVENVKNKDYNYGFSGVDIIFYADTDTTTADWMAEKELFTPMSSQVMIVVKNEKGEFVQPTFKKDGDEFAAFANFGIANFNEAKNRFRFAMYKEYFEEILKTDSSEEPYPEFYLRLPSSPFNASRVTLYNTDFNNKDLYPRVKVKYVKY